MLNLNKIDIPIPIAPKIRATIRDMAFSEYPKEACGVLVQNNSRVIAAKNVADNPHTDFEIDPLSAIAAEKAGGVTCYWHSHTNGNLSFSTTDVAQCKHYGIPWYLISLPVGVEKYIDPKVTLPYLGREFIYGYSDCYALVRDILEKEHHIKLADFDRKDLLDLKSSGWDMFQQNFSQQGFRQVDGLASRQPGDIFLMQIFSPNANHVGILMQPERNIFYHHLVDRLSESSVYGGYWEKVTVATLRHKELMR